MSWDIYQPVEVVFGEGAVKGIGDVLARHGIERALIACGSTIAKSGLAEKVAGYAGGRVVGIAPDVEPEASAQDVDAVAAKARELGADCIIGLGGGSAMDCAKSAAVCAKQGLAAQQIMFGIEDVDALPIIMVPTTAGTGSEVTQGASILDKERGIPGGIDGRFATVAVVDPELTYTMPRSVTVATGMDALSHALETLERRDVHPYSERLAVAAARQIFENFERVVENPDDRDARAKMMEASLLAGLACSQTGLAGAHACAMVLGGMFRLPRGVAVAMTLDRWVRLNAAANPKIDGYAREMGFADAEAMADKVVELRRAFEMPMTLGDLGADETCIEPLAQAAVANFFGWMEGNCAPQDLDQMRAMYRSLL